MKIQNRELIAREEDLRFCATLTTVCDINRANVRKTNETLLKSNKGFDEHLSRFAVTFDPLTLVFDEEVLIDQ